MGCKNSGFPALDFGLGRPISRCKFFSLSVDCLCDLSLFLLSFRIPEFIQVLQTHECFLHHLRSRVNVPSTDRDAGMPGDLLNRERVRPISTFVVFQLYDKELFAVVATLAPSMKSCMSFKAAGAFSDAAIWTVYRPVIVQGRSIRESSSPNSSMLRPDKRLPINLSRASRTRKSLRQRLWSSQRSSSSANSLQRSRTSTSFSEECLSGSNAVWGAYMFLKNSVQQLPRCATVYEGASVPRNGDLFSTPGQYE